MAWITISEADLLTALSGDELAAYREAALDDSQPDPVAPTIAQVADLVRGYVGGHSSNVLGPAGTIPQKLLAPAVDLIVARIPNRVGQSPKKGRETAAENAIKLLEQVARGNFDIEEPVEQTEEPSSTGAGRPSFNGRKRRDVRRESSGL